MLSQQLDPSQSRQVRCVSPRERVVPMSSHIGTTQDASGPSEIPPTSLVIRRSSVRVRTQAPIQRRNWPTFPSQTLGGRLLDLQDLGAQLRLQLRASRGSG
jgi:hypothetical protein